MTKQASRGIVYLVGAGPGDAGLLTVRAADLLGRADTVVYDFLANPKLLSYCPQADKIYVGKKSSDHTLSQEQINALLVDLGQKGKRVVRLKGGDPFVFGRGGEEAEALAAAKIRFEIVPGITAAIAAAAYAGIPVTHRDFNSSFTLVTGHEKEEDSAAQRTQAHGSPSVGFSDIDWRVLAQLPCIAFYMGVKSLPRICANLIANGKPATTPAATIQWGTHPNQRTCVATLADLPQRVADAKIGAPAITIVGEVVKMRDTINWFETRPLFGQTIVVTRTRQQASELSLQLEELGASVIEAPTIELHPPTDRTEIDKILCPPTPDPRPPTPDSYDWLIFTSVNGVLFTRDRLRELGRDVRIFGNAKIAAVGQVTAAAIREHLALHVDVCPESFVAEALADTLSKLGEIASKRFLLLRADIARPVLREKLERGGAAEVGDLAVYETRPVTALPPEVLETLKSGKVNWITFTSASTAKNLVQLLGDDYRTQLANIRLASIGPVTTKALQELGLTPTVEAKQSNIDSLVRAIEENTPTA